MLWVGKFLILKNSINNFLKSFKFVNVQAYKTQQFKFVEFTWQVHTYIKQLSINAYGGFFRGEIFHD